MDIKVYELNNVRVIPDGQSFLVVASDLAKQWGYRDADKLTRLLDDSEKGTHKVGTPGGNQNTNVITEKGLNRLVSTLRRSELKAWQDKLYGEIIPQWTRTGMAVDIDRVDLSDITTVLEIAGRAGEIAKEFKARAELAESRNLELEATNLRIAPLAKAHEEWQTAQGAYPMDTAAHMLGTGRNRLFAQLRDLGVLKKLHSEPIGTEVHSGHIPYQQFIDRGYFFTVASRHWMAETGITKVEHKVHITPKGLEWLKGKLADSQITKVVDGGNLAT